jgi:hypothetical protein
MIGVITPSVCCLQEHSSDGKKLRASNGANKDAEADGANKDAEADGDNSAEEEALRDKDVEEEEGLWEEEEGLWEEEEALEEEEAREGRLQAIPGSPSEYVKVCI